MSKQVYINNDLKYIISNKEYKNIDKAWKLINIFNKPFVSVTDQRNYLIKYIKRNYTANEFYFLENIIEKMFWNLRWAVFPLFVKSKSEKIPDELIMCEKLKYDDDLDEKIGEIISNNDTYYRSFINKIIIVDKANKTIYNKKMEGSSDIFSKNSFNLYTMTVLLNRDLYERVMSDPHNIKNLDIELPHYYYQYDYGFPNLNYCAFNVGDKEFKLNRINKMYYNKDASHWFKLIL